MSKQKEACKEWGKTKRVPKEPGFLRLIEPIDKSHKNIETEE